MRGHPACFSSTPVPPAILSPVQTATLVPLQAATRRRPRIMTSTTTGRDAGSTNNHHRDVPSTLGSSLYVTGVKFPSLWATPDLSSILVSHPLPPLHYPSLDPLFTFTAAYHHYQPIRSPLHSTHTPIVPFNSTGMIIITYHTNHMHPHQLFIPSRIHLFIPRTQVPSTANITQSSSARCIPPHALLHYTVYVFYCSLASLAYVSRT